MKFWFIHSGEVSLREQICTQVWLAIVSGELRAGQRLPSTREMARRFGLHPNTVSGAYQQLQDEGRVERRHGSGVYVLAPKSAAAQGPEHALDRMIAAFLTAARSQGFSNADVVERVRHWMAARPADHFLLVEPEEERVEIVLRELREALDFPVRSCGFEDCAKATGAIAIALPSKAVQARALLPPNIELVALKVSSVPMSMRDWIPVPEEALVGIVSRWPEFVRIAKTMLVASGFHADALLERVRGTQDWQEGLTTTAAVVCDVATADVLPKSVKAMVFRLVCEESIEELRQRAAALQRSA